MLIGTGFSIQYFSYSKLGQAKAEAGQLVWKLLQVHIAPAKSESTQLLHFELDKKRLRLMRRREGCYLLRSNLIAIEPAQLWELYIQLTQIEQAFRNLKGDLAIRPIYHQLQEHFRGFYHLLLAGDFASPTPHCGLGSDTTRCI
ncbi:MAG: hypothetical protein JO076_01235 [Verrucomicrobia bacterium]|nr:hypothetical protein [Verrucomicrobiota bacterium]